MRRGPGMTMAAAISLALGGAQESPARDDQQLELLQPAPLPAEDALRPAPLQVTITPRRFEEMVDALPAWAEIPLGNGEVGNLLGFLERTLEHDVDFRLSDLMREAKRALMPDLPAPRRAPLTVAEADAGMILGGAYLGLRPGEIRLRLGVRKGLYDHVDTARGIYGAVDPIWCHTGPLDCISYTLGGRARLFEALLGEN